MKENWHTSCSCLGWCVMYHELQPSMQTLSPLSIHQWVHWWGWYTIVHTTKQGDHIHTGHTIIQGWTSMDGIKLAYFLLLPWLVYDVPWNLIIHIDFNTLLNSSMYAWVRLIHHCTSNRARGSNPYWPHNTPKMDQHGWKKIGTVSSSALDGVWCTMRSNHSYRCWHPSQFINVFMGEVDPLLHNQPIKGITSILTTQYYKDGP